MGEETLLASQRAVPRRLLDTAFVFKFPGISEACVEALTQH
jgi:NAD dependent epimerase/dehydratase family enzyme